LPKKNGSGENIVVDGKDGEMVNKEKMIDGLRASNQKEKGKKMARDMECNDVTKGKWVQMKNNVFTLDYGQLSIWSIFAKKKFHKRKVLNDFFLQFFIKNIHIFSVYHFLNHFLVNNNF